MQSDEVNQNDTNFPEQENQALNDLQVATQIPVSAEAKEGVKQSFRKNAGTNWLAIFGLILGGVSTVLYFYVHVLLAFLCVVIGIIASILGLQFAQHTRSGVKLAISATATCLLVAGLIIYLLIRIAYD